MRTPSSAIAGCHLGLAGHAIAERERDLDDAHARAVRALRRLDLEHVALRARRGDVDRPERRCAPELEAAGEIGVGQAERDRRRGAADAAGDAAVQRPAVAAAARQVARAEHEIGAAPELLEHLRQERRRVREVGVELADGGVIALEAPGEAGAVGVAEAVLAAAVQDVQPGPSGGHAIGECAGAVGRGVVDDEQLDAARLALERLDEPVQRAGLVVGGNHDEDGRDDVHEARMRCRRAGVTSQSLGGRAATVERPGRLPGSPATDVQDCGARGLAVRAHACRRAPARPPTMLQELDIRREDTATVRLLWDDRTEIVWLHVLEDAGAEHVVGVPAAEAQDAFLCPVAVRRLRAGARGRRQRRARPRLRARHRRGMIAA